jgi:sarcosine oxidase subunit alpha
LLRATSLPQAEYDLAIVGGGPAGICAALQFAASSQRIALFDENDRIGGQLLKQTHKFFGSSDTFSGLRGFQIASLLEEKIRSVPVTVFSGVKVWALDEKLTLWLKHPDYTAAVKCRALILACGAKEKAVIFPGWTLPGVLYAGALQTMVNLWGVIPGRRVVILGAGNVGLIVAYQLVQAGMEVVGIIEKKQSIGGFQVHANRIRRLGIPVFLDSELLAVEGGNQVEWALVRSAGKRVRFAVDVVCIAAGMNPQLELLRLLGGALGYDEARGGQVPLQDASLRILDKNVFVCGDMCGIEEASIAMEEGKLAGLSARGLLGRGESAELVEGIQSAAERLRELRSGDK